MADSVKGVQQYLPLSEATYYILLALIEPLHGYGVMQKATALSNNTVEIGPGTLYGAFATLEKEGLIIKVSEEDRRKCFGLTLKGKQVLRAQIERLQIMAQSGQNVLEQLSE